MENKKKQGGYTEGEWDPKETAKNKFWQKIAAANSDLFKFAEEEIKREGKGKTSNEFLHTNFMKDMEACEEMEADKKKTDWRKKYEDGKACRTVGYSSGGEIKEVVEKGWWGKTWSGLLDFLCPGRIKERIYKEVQRQEKRFNLYSDVDSGRDDPYEDDNGVKWDIVVKRKFGDAPGAERYEWRKVD